MQAWLLGHSPFLCGWSDALSIDSADQNLSHK
jgi:hypothetical protein